MKKGIITVFVTLFIFFSSTLGVFAQEVTQNSWSVDAQYWLYDLMLQSTVGRNILAGDWGYAEGTSGTGTFMFQLDAGYDVYYKYTVPANETVYFRWAVPMFSAHEGQTIKVDTYVNGSKISSNSYSRNSTGFIGTNGAVTFIEDYINSSSESVTVEFYILNNANDFGLQLIPIKCGTRYFFNESINDNVSSDILVDIDLSFIESKLEDLDTNQQDIKDLLADIKDLNSDINVSIGTLNSSVTLNGQKLDSINSTLTTIKNTTNNIYTTLTNIKTVLDWCRLELADINVNTMQMAITLNQIYDYLVNGTDSEKLSAMDNANNVFKDSVNEMVQLEDTLTSDFVLNLNSLPVLNRNDVVDSGIGKGIDIISSTVDSFFYLHEDLSLFYSIILLLGIALTIIGRGTK